MMVWGMLLMLLMALPVSAPAEGEQTGPTRIFLVRHAEYVKGDPGKPLSKLGRARADVLARCFDGVAVTHVFASHTERSRDTVTPLATAHGLSVRQHPAPGATLAGKVVDNRTSGKAAIAPLLSALAEVPAGSTVVVGGNSGNLFAIMAGLGVPVAGDDRREVPPEAGDGVSVAKTLPCRDKSCFPKKDFASLWLVVVPSSPSGKASMARIHYGDPMMALTAAVGRD